MNTSLNEVYTWLEENQGTLSDTISPALSIAQPTGTTSSNPTYTESTTYTVSGTVTDNSSIAKVTVNGEGATINGAGWSKSITVTAGTTTTITVVATDNAGNSITLVRYLYAYSITTYNGSSLTGFGPYSSSILIEGSTSTSGTSLYMNMQGRDQRTGWVGGGIGPISFSGIKKIVVNINFTTNQATSCNCVISAHSNIPTNYGMVKDQSKGAQSQYKNTVTGTQTLTYNSPITSGNYYLVFYMEGYYNFGAPSLPITAYLNNIKVYR